MPIGFTPWNFGTYGTAGMVSRRASRYTGRDRVHRPKRRAKGYMRTGGYFGRYPPGGRRAELKWVDQNVNNLIGVTGLILGTGGTLNIIPQGVGESERVGRKVIAKSIMIRGKMRMDADSAAANASNIFRIIMYLDKQANGATATVADILEDIHVQSHYNLENKSRFRILYDKTSSIRSMSGAGNAIADDGITYGENTAVIIFRKKLNFPIEYSDSLSTGDISTIRSNNIGMLAIVLAPNPTMQFQFTVRLRFKDS